MDFLSSVSANVSAFFSANPSVLFVQSLMLSAASIVIFLVLFTTRDILLRSQSFLLQIFCIVLVAVLPLFGFLIYLLIRPSRTLAMERLERKLNQFLERANMHQQHQQHRKHQQQEKEGQKKRQ